MTFIRILHNYIISYKEENIHPTGRVDYKCASRRGWPKIRPLNYSKRLTTSAGISHNMRISLFPEVQSPIVAICFILSRPVADLGSFRPSGDTVLSGFPLLSISGEMIFFSPREISSESTLRKREKKREGEGSGECRRTMLEQADLTLQ